MFCPSQNSKYRDLPEFQFSREGEGGWGSSVLVKIKSDKICLNFNFRGWGSLLNQIPEWLVLAKLVEKFWKTIAFAFASLRM